jgi:hypothetical protein
VCAYAAMEPVEDVVISKAVADDGRTPNRRPSRLHDEGTGAVSRTAPHEVRRERAAYWPTQTPTACLKVTTGAADAAVVTDIRQM